MADGNEAKLEAARGWFKGAQYGLMVHWGRYALLDGEWRGRVMPGIAEWAQAYFRTPNAENAALAEAFDPVLFDAGEWVRIALGRIPAPAAQILREAAPTEATK